MQCVYFRGRQRQPWYCRDKSPKGILQSYTHRHIFEWLLLRRKNHQTDVFLQGLSGGSLSKKLSKSVIYVSLAHPNDINSMTSIGPYKYTINLIIKVSQLR